MSTDSTLKTTDKTIVGAINELCNAAKLIPIEKGRTSVTTADTALTKLKSYMSVDDLEFNYPFTAVDIIKAMPTSS